MSFYHWKAKANYPASFQDALNAANTNTIYMHYFDIDAKKPNYWNVVILIIIVLIFSFVRKLSN